jgi:hypothetical protein
LPIGDCQLKTPTVEVHGKSTDACTVKLALCVSFYLTSQHYLFVKSDNSHYSIIKEPELLSTERRNFNIQMGAYDETTFSSRCL